MALHKPYLLKFVYVRRPRLAPALRVPRYDVVFSDNTHTCPEALKSKIIRDTKHAKTRTHIQYMRKTPPACSLYIVHGYQASRSSVLFHVFFHPHELCVLWASGCARFVWLCGCLPVSEEELWHGHATVNVSLSSRWATEGLSERGRCTVARREDESEGGPQAPIKV